jgi:hypothetical protein
VKKRRDWTAWKAKREAELRQRRETNKIIVKMLTEQIDAMHRSDGLIARLMVPKPLPFFGGKKMQFPLIYKEK